MAANDESPIAASSDTERRLSAFEEKLPLEIRRQIYGELLKSENVRQPPDAYLVQQYKFDTRILGNYSLSRMSLISTLTRHVFRCEQAYLSRGIPSIVPREPVYCRVVQLESHYRPYGQVSSCSVGTFQA